VTQKARPFFWKPLLANAHWISLSLIACNYWSFLSDQYWAGCPRPQGWSRQDACAPRDEAGRMPADPGTKQAGCLRPQGRSRQDACGPRDEAGRMPAAPGTKQAGCPRPQGRSRQDACAPRLAAISKQTVKSGDIDSPASYYRHSGCAVLGIAVDLRLLYSIQKSYASGFVYCLNRMCLSFKKTSSFPSSYHL